MNIEMFLNQVKNVFADQQYTLAETTQIYRDYTTSENALKYDPLINKLMNDVANGIDITAHEKQLDFFLWYFLNYVIPPHLLTSEKLRQSKEKKIQLKNNRSIAFIADGPEIIGGIYFRPFQDQYTEAIEKIILQRTKAKRVEIKEIIHYPHNGNGRIFVTLYYRPGKFKEAEFAIGYRPLF